ncbi:hypothetical protein A3D80_01195 [Candidatus Roizmanbacteria bacterium RIFCSPHIGHO2_02_FULL_40_13b]|uniref:FCP1 homology domain-containing protein n=1 Tax=Candidatus Roizmanbacteria bacterium RIFCSPHIGHO2_01_FULL_39_24 TaxID=1802032 RepID=A0A1F7GHY7_9BACT|nr:MAG: hypothetical protein A2799_02990 [Candidatus Roizmanbacteria bacterium RIFCSPHIGHO2_01_FULL_39_24]OGK26340.1 MAG: hypothetical protein A3D80_01195 [Candidatus Roizmanbacteria bacterium RIFCSPHIGHO2_02_FULL_40_13b]OGK56820.1 MAG: hypothetical protein A3H83_03740 [Candidatus Roizmanbacteria bacterium RIFCSPLOWO2_02_FULL_39_8]
MNKPLKVGFDLDGVLLYNPTRIARQPIVLFKHIFMKKREKKFVIPKSKFVKFVYKLLHLSSFMYAAGLDDIEKLVRAGKIEAHIITARFDFLEDDFKKKLIKLNRGSIFTSAHINRKNEQPHLFKERKINELGLDVFVEDNYDIVNHLNKKSNAKVYWIYNIFDRNIIHPFKFPNLKEAVTRLKKNI